jgi:hypothetical protein
MLVAANAASDWVQIAVTAFLGVVTVFVGLSLTLKRRQETAVKVAESRFGAYTALWETIPYSPELRRLKKEPPLTPQQLERLFDKLTDWYYEGGRGMLLGNDARAIYLTVKKNMLCEAPEFVPKSQREAVAGSAAARSELVVRQLSLLRSAMRADLQVYGEPWGKRLDEVDREFLDACGVSLWRIEHGLRERLRLLTGGRRASEAPAAGDAATT